MVTTATQQLDVKAIASQDAAYWSKLNLIKLQDGVFEFKNHPYLVEPMQQHMLYRNGLSPEQQCVMKATQLGFSETGVLASLHGMIYRHYPKGVLYLFPTTEDMQEFSKSRFGPLLKANPSAIKQYVKDTNTASLKQIGNANLYMRGARLTQTIDGEAKEAGKLRGISVDCVRYDEFDLMDQEVPGKAEGRLGNSLVNEQYFVSNPTVPGFGISALFNRSDQRHWFRRCLHCGISPPSGADWSWYVTKSNGWTSAEVMFPNNVELGADNKGYIACVGCGKPVGLDVGCWVPKEPSYSDKMWGYQLSQLTSARKDPYRILQDYTNPPEGNLGDVMRFKLGLPFISAEDKLSKQQVLGNCGIGLQLNSHTGPCAMGVDIRRHKNVVIGCKMTNNSYRVVRVARVESMADVMSLALRFNVRIGVIDIRPYEDEVREFQKAAKFLTYLCEYKENTAIGASWNENTGLVVMNRTEIMDASHRMLKDSLIELPAKCPEVEQFAKECASVAKVPEENRRTRTTTFRYRKLGTTPDDYRHALNYFIMAATSQHLPVVGGRRRNQSRGGSANNEYNRF